MQSMTLQEFSQLVHKYRVRSGYILAGFVFFWQLLKLYFVNSLMDRRSELGLPAIENSPEIGFIWIGVVLGLFVVLNLCFYGFEKILVRLFFSDPNAGQEQRKG
ncbi:hypothetical protein EMM73_15915 [Rheinheimera sediminis]|uniref:hypothetical protein n=1 Tax=Rheinheimera sp. YQF-1 TaxID=2499626 RepID=UPI000FD8390A|nr:hypothetical protein [Rheinheimera sp. YQF-1]RVT44788.1 hypothetical protein EMM73_15915 [Rheinheimera sp. YQF-1]